MVTTPLSLDRFEGQNDHLFFCGLIEFPFPPCEPGRCFFFSLKKGRRPPLLFSRTERRADHSLFFLLLSRTYGLSQLTDFEGRFLLFFLGVTPSGDWQIGTFLPPWERIAPPRSCLSPRFLFPW